MYHNHLPGDHEARAIGVVLLRAIVDADTAVGSVLLLVNGDVAVLDEDNGVGAFADTKDALGKPGKFSGVQFAPKFLILRVGEKVSHFHELSSVLVEDCIEEVSGE